MSNNSQCGEEVISEFKNTSEHDLSSHSISSDLKLNISQDNGSSNDGGNFHKEKRNKSNFNSTEGNKQLRNQLKLMRQSATFRIQNQNAPILLDPISKRPSQNLVLSLQPDGKNYSSNLSNNQDDLSDNVLKEVVSFNIKNNHNNSSSVQSSQSSSLNRGQTSYNQNGDRKQYVSPNPLQKKRKIVGLHSQTEGKVTRLPEVVDQQHIHHQPVGLTQIRKVERNLFNEIKSPQAVAGSLKPPLPGQQHRKGSMLSHPMSPNGAHQGAQFRNVSLDLLRLSGSLAMLTKSRPSNRRHLFNTLTQVLPHLSP
ncbi:hypothetical protein FGO68_gene5558 [Halteria grandinella]|uniref:Uncharacterized protein n=1 Tax=Halteria grandinella TaxID=5974 RepID=A0A8J8NGL1_HALGN|nr:hypothetical protein FGO68_gene5558 [Halteria grandinella]